MQQNTTHLQHRLRQASSVLALLFLGLLLPMMAVAQSGRQASCPYDTTRPPCNTDAVPGGCPIPNYKFLWQQDCCGSIRLCKDTNTVYNQGGTSVPGRISAGICGEGCRTGEINGTNTCLSSSENQTSWYTFEIRPLPNGGRRIGDFAGYLRLKILPCDVPPNNETCTTTCDCDAVTSTHPAVFNDNGSQSIGLTDYDWVLYEVSSFPRNQDLNRACPLISNASEITAARPNGRPWVRSCNYSGTSGPTGMYDANSFPGFGTTADSSVGGIGNRYNTPIKVYVGQRFVLAVDNFSTNPKGYKIDFTGRGNRIDFTRFGVPDEYPTATVVPPSGRIFLDTAIEVTSCSENAITIRFNREVPVDSIVPNRFKIENPNRPRIIITGIAPDPADVVLGFARKFKVSVNALYTGNGYKFIQTLGISDPCGTQDFLDTAVFDIKPFTYVDTVPQACQNPDIPAKYGNSLRSATIKSKISRLVPFQPSEYRYQWKIFSRVVGTDSVFVPLNASNDSLTLIPPVLNLPQGSRVGPALTYQPRGNGVDAYRLPVRLIASLTNGLCTDSVTFSVLAKPTPYYPRNTVNVCFGQPIRLSLPAADTVGRNLRWISRIRDNWERRTKTLTYIADSVAYDSLQIEIYDRAAQCTFLTKPFAVQTAQRYYPAFKVDTVNVTGAVYPLTVHLLDRTRILQPNGLIVPVVNYRGLRFDWSLGNGDRRSTNNRDTLRYTYFSPGAQDQYGTNIGLNLVDTLAGLAVPPCPTAYTSENLVVVSNPQRPNVISPSGDGLNENFEIRGVSPKTSLKVFNRYGVLVFSKDEYKNDFNGNNLPVGSYYYLANDQLTGQKITGWIEIMR